MIVFSVFSIHAFTYNTDSVAFSLEMFVLLLLYYCGLHTRNAANFHQWNRCIGGIRWPNALYKSNNSCQSSHVYLSSTPIFHTFLLPCCCYCCCCRFSTACRSMCTHFFFHLFRRHGILLHTHQQQNLRCHDLLGQYYAVCQFWPRRRHKIYGHWSDITMQMMKCRPRFTFFVFHVFIFMLKYGKERPTSIVYDLRAVNIDIELLLFRSHFLFSICLHEKINKYATRMLNTKTHTT